MIFVSLIVKVKLNKGILGANQLKNRKITGWVGCLHFSADVNFSRFSNLFFRNSYNLKEHYD